MAELGVSVTRQSTSGNGSLGLLLWAFAASCSIDGWAGASTIGEVTNLRLRGGAPTILEWDAVTGATGYDILVAQDASLTGGVEFLVFNAVELSKSDPFTPEPGSVRYYLVRAREGPLIGTWGVLSSGIERLANDADRDAIADAFDNCRLLFNTLQGDLDDDGLGDDCDNCPTERNPGQQDGNGDGGGDACAPSVRVDALGDGFVPDPGIAPALLDPGLPHPSIPGVVHPVIQFSRVLADDQRRRLRDVGVELHEALSFNVFLASVRQENLNALGGLPFVRSVFPLPTAARIGLSPSCDRLAFGTWRSLATAVAPAARASHAVAHDADRGSTLLFGGDADGGPTTANLSDTWEWNGQSWLQRLPAHRPAARSEHAMTWDEARAEVVLFGGLVEVSEANQLVDSNETWTWNGSDWTLETPANIPAPRRGHAMAYDRARRQVVLFGGIDASGTPMGDTWTWDGSNWHARTPPNAPSPRAQHAMAWDGGSERIVLFGGETGTGIVGDTWVWTGETWLRLDVPGGPAPRASQAMASRWNSCGVSLFGGKDRAGGPLSDAWFLNGSHWTPVQVPQAPAPRSEHVLSYDATHRRHLLFGGVDSQGAVTGETSRLEPKQIRYVIFHQDVPHSIAASILAAHGAVVLGPGGDIAGGQRITTWSAAVPDAEVAALASEEPVVHVQVAGVTVEANDGARTAIGADEAQLLPFYCGDGCTGTGVVVAQWDTGWAAGDDTPPPFPTVTHDALAGRVIARDGSLLDPSAPSVPAGCEGFVSCDGCHVTDHATHIAGTMLGDGAGLAPMRGVAPTSTSISYEKQDQDLLQIGCELRDAYVNFGARAANNSFATSLDPALYAEYDAASMNYDLHSWTLPAEAVVFAAGNEQRERWRWIAKGYLVPLPPMICTPAPPGVVVPPIPVPPDIVTQRFLTLPSGFGQPAKNTLVIGGINSGAPSVPGSLGRMTTFSSWGPTRDGRIKPDLVAAGAENNQRDLDDMAEKVCACGFVCNGVPAPPPPACDPDPKLNSTVCDSIDELDGCSAASTSYAAFDGTSNSAPAVTGGAALLMEQHQLVGPLPGDALDSDSLKALLIHTATDLPVHFPVGGDFMGLQDCDGDLQADDCWPIPAVTPGVVQDGPDYVNGWGLVNLPAALAKIQAGNPEVILQPSSCPNGVTYPSLPFNSTLPIGGDPASVGLMGCGSNTLWGWVGYIDVPLGTNQLKVTLAWDDPQSVPGPNPMDPLLVNDLDLIVTRFSGVGGFSTGAPNFSWWLDPFCPYRPAVPVSVAGVSPALLADHRNNVEQVVVGTPGPGTWRIVVQSGALATPQTFAIMISTPPSVP